jgi:hypothetical protein
MKRTLLVISGLIVLSIFLYQGYQKEDAKLTHVSSVFEVDEVFGAMTGPLNQVFNVPFNSEDHRELIWLTGFEAESVGPDQEDMPDEFLCHAAVWMECKVSDYRALWGEEGFGSGRFFTLAQGQTSMKFPEGFALPAPGGQTFSLTTQLLNEWEENVGTKIRHRTQLYFDRNSELAKPPTPLALFEVTSLVYMDPKEAAEVGQPSAEMVPVHGGDGVDSEGRHWSAHWLVPPGRHEYRSPAKLVLPYDTKAHYIAIHLHRLAESCELIDTTTGEVVYHADAHHTNGRLSKVDNYSSAEGIPLYKDHEYEIVSVYNNTEDKKIGAMAIAFIYVEDKLFKMPDLNTLVAPAPIVGPNREMFCAFPEDM